jgi:hypothetical protein
MKAAVLVRELEQLIVSLGMRVRFEKGSFRGGRCTLSGDAQVVLNKMHPPEAHLAILAEALRDVDLDAVYLKPAVRRALEDAWARQTIVEGGVDDG